MSWNRAATEKKTPFKIFKLYTEVLGALSEDHAGRLKGVHSFTEFYADKGIEVCAICGLHMNVEKTVRRQISTMSFGNTSVIEYALVCPARCMVPAGTLYRERSPELAAMVARGANYGYDIETFVGL
jgi:hypothetical protein